MRGNIFSKLLKNIPGMEKKNDNFESDENKQEYNSTIKNVGVAGGVSEIAQEHAEKAADTFRKLDKNLIWKEKRKQLEPSNAKLDFKNKAFDGNEIIKDRYSDNSLVMKRADAEVLFGKENFNKHLAHADHITPLEKIYASKENCAWDSIEDIKEIANADENFVVINGKLNESKQHRTNSEYLDYLEKKGRGDEISPEYRKIMLQDQADSERYLKKAFKKREIENVVKTGHKAGIDAAKTGAVIGGGISAIQNVVAVVKGEKDATEAAFDTAKDTAGAAVLSYGTGALGTTMSHSLSYSSNTMLKSLSQTNLPSQIAVAAIETGKTMKRFICGEIDGTECMTELGEKGTGMIASSYGAFAGQVLIPIPIVGGLIGSMVGYAFSSTYYNSILSIMQSRKLAHEERIRIEAECKETIKAIKAYRIEIEKVVEKYFKEHKIVFDNAFNTIHYALQTGDADGVIMGANMITEKLGGEIQYNNMDEFDDFMNDENTDFIL